MRKGKNRQILVKKENSIETFITPLLLCLALCWFIISKTGVGGWIYIPGFFFGMGGSATVAYKFYLSVNRQNKKQSKSKKIYFNRHS